MKKFTIICLVLVLYLTMPECSYSLQPPYQVSIFLKMPGSYVKPIHICNGAIIYEKLILTTADCLHFKFGVNGKSNKLDASVISVLAGSRTAKNDALQMNVSSIEFPNNFDSVTQENDLALLTLSQSLPLETRTDIRWIMIDDNSHMNRSCLVNFYSRNTKDAISDYYQTEELYMVNNEICRNHTSYPDARKRDICSFYALPQQFDCERANSFLSFNNDRGSGLVCKSFLVGLLSSVVTRPDPANNCSDVIQRAIYTNINPHLRWIYSIMSKMETEYISTPYDSSLNPLMAIPDPSPIVTVNSTSAVNSATLHNSTESSYLFNNQTLSNHFSSNSSIVNSTLSNSTFVNSTILNYATRNPLPINSTKWNTTSIGGNTARNHTTKPVTFHNGSSTGPLPGYGSPTDLHTKHSNTKPEIQNIFKSCGDLLRFSAWSLLIPLVSLRLTAIYLYDNIANFFS